MQNKIIYLILSVFIMIGIPLAGAGQRDVNTNNAPEQTAMSIIMSDEALASYISGRLKLALRNGDDIVEQYCDSSGCAVIVR